MEWLYDIVKMNLNLKMNEIWRNLPQITTSFAILGLAADVVVKHIRIKTLETQVKHIREDYDYFISKYELSDR